MNEVLGVINLINEHPFLKALTRHRCLASVPFGGRYRLIDFTMSNLVNADISKVAVFSKEKYRSLMDHLGSGKEWDLDRHNGGLYVLPPIDPGEPTLGDLQHFHSHLEFFERSPQDMVVISPATHICRMDFSEILDFHYENNADVTVVYKDYNGTAASKPYFHKCFIDTEQNVTDIELFSFPKRADHICLETYVIRKELLMELIQSCIENDEYDFLRDALKANLDRFHVKAYPFTGYMPFVHSFKTFYESNMAFLDPKVSQPFFFGKGDIFTKVKHEAPSRYSKDADVSNSLIANGCEIEGRVENSILFRGVKVKKGASVKNSIIMQKGEIEPEACVENVIADRQVRITGQTEVIGKKGPRIIRKATIL